MKKQKICFGFYLLCTELKDKIRSGWKIWHIERERAESIAEHIYGTCILAIAIDSEFDLKINLEKVVMMLVLHEVEEIEIGDLTPFDEITKEEKRRIGKEAVENILKNLNKRIKYIELIEEFEKMETKESMFAKMCDKLEADIQCKIYTEEKSLDINKKENEKLIKHKSVEKLYQKGAKTIAELFIESDRSMFADTVFEKIADFVKENNILELKKEN